MLVRVLYVSVVAPGIAAADIRKLVAAARRRNRQLDITGALAICEARFVQVIEGRQDAVQEMLTKIAGDPRHSDIKVISRTNEERRLCDGWDMAFFDEADWDHVIDRVLSGDLTPNEFYRILLNRVEEKNAESLALRRLEE